MPMNYSCTNMVKDTTNTISGSVKRAAAKLNAVVGNNVGSSANAIKATTKQAQTATSGATSKEKAAVDTTVDKVAGTVKKTANGARDGINSKKVNGAAKTVTGAISAGGK